MEATEKPENLPKSSLYNLFAACYALRSRIQQFEATAMEFLNLTDLEIGCFIVTSLRPIQPKTIAELIGVSRGTISPVLARLEQAGYLERYTNEGDARSVLIGLTPEGRAKLRSLEQHLGQQFHSTALRVDDAGFDLTPMLEEVEVRVRRRRRTL